MHTCCDKKMGDNRNKTKPNKHSKEKLQFVGLN